MSFYFNNFPKISYDLKFKNKSQIVTNIMLRYKIVETIKKNRGFYYTYTVQEAQRPDNVAFELYGQSDLSWFLLLINNMHDPIYDWPLGYRDFISYIESRYGSVPAAQSTVHEYRKILNQQKVLFDGTIIPKRTLKVDLTTYNTLFTTVKESISKYDYEVELNDNKRNIIYVDTNTLGSVLSELSDVFR